MHIDYNKKFKMFSALIPPAIAMGYKLYNSTSPNPINSQPHKIIKNI